MAAISGARLLLSSSGVQTPSHLISRPPKCSFSLPWKPKAHVTSMALQNFSPACLPFLPSLHSRPNIAMPISCPNLAKQAHRRGVRAKVEYQDRVVAGLGYFLPFFDGIQYGRYLFMQYPQAERLVEPLFPVLNAYKSFPYASFVAFFALYLLVVRNQSFSRYVRFNAMQAIVLDVLTIIPGLLERTFSPGSRAAVGVFVMFYNTVFLFLVACFLFGVISCLLGKTPRLPLVANAADAQV